MAAPHANRAFNPSASVAPAGITTTIPRRPPPAAEFIPKLESPLAGGVSGGAGLMAALPPIPNPLTPNKPAAAAPSTAASTAPAVVPASSTTAAATASGTASTAASAASGAGTSSSSSTAAVAAPKPRVTPAVGSLGFQINPLSLPLLRSSDGVSKQHRFSRARAWQSTEIVRQNADGYRVRLGRAWRTAQETVLTYDVDDTCDLWVAIDADGQYMCKICPGPKVFAELHMCNRHMRGVHGDKVVPVCRFDTCGKRFADAARLKKHQTIHMHVPGGGSGSGVTDLSRPFACPHTGTVPGVGVVYGGKPYALPACTAVFQSEIELFAHQLLVHANGETPFVCAETACVNAGAKAATAAAAAAATASNFTTGAGGGAAAAVASAVAASTVTIAAFATAHELSHHMRAAHNIKVSADSLCGGGGLTAASGTATAASGGEAVKKKKKRPAPAAASGDGDGSGGDEAASDDDGAAQPAASAVAVHAPAVVPHETDYAKRKKRKAAKEAAAKEAAAKEAAAKEAKEAAAIAAANKAAIAKAVAAAALPPASDTPTAAASRSAVSFLTIPTNPAAGIVVTPRSGAGMVSPAAYMSLPPLPTADMPLPPLPAGAGADMNLPPLPPAAENSVGYSMSEWSCGQCTLINTPVSLACQVCGAVRPKQAKAAKSGGSGSGASHPSAYRGGSAAGGTSSAPAAAASASAAPVRGNANDPRFVPIQRTKKNETQSQTIDFGAQPKPEPEPEPKKRNAKPKSAAAAADGAAGGGGKEKDWRCATCRTINEPQLWLCEGCGGPRPRAKVAAPPKRANGGAGVKRMPNEPAPAAAAASTVVVTELQQQPKPVTIRVTATGTIGAATQPPAAAAAAPTATATAAAAPTPAAAAATADASAAVGADEWRCAHCAHVNPLRVVMCDKCAKPKPRARVQPPSALPPNLVTSIAGVGVAPAAAPVASATPIAAASAAASASAAGARQEKSNAAAANEKTPASAGSGGDRKAGAAAAASASRSSATATATAAAADWACGKCSTLNGPALFMCDACAAPRPRATARPPSIRGGRGGAQTRIVPASAASAAAAASTGDATAAPKPARMVYRMKDEPAPKKEAGVLHAAAQVFTIDASAATATAAATAVDHKSTPAAATAAAAGADAAEQYRTRRTTELQHIRSRFGDSYQLHESTSGDGSSTLTLLFCPSAPDFPYSFPTAYLPMPNAHASNLSFKPSKAKLALHLSFGLPRDYPAPTADPICVKVNNDPRDIPLVFASIIETAVDKYAATTPPAAAAAAGAAAGAPAERRSLRDVLRWLDKSLPDLIELGLHKQKLSAAAGAAASGGDKKHSAAATATATAAAPTATAAPASTDSKSLPPLASAALAAGDAKGRPPSAASATPPTPVAATMDLSKLSGVEYYKYLHTLNDPRMIEVEQLHRRFHDSFAVTRDTDTTTLLCSFTLHPSDPDFPYEFASGLLGTLRVPAGYPAAVATLRIRNDTDELPYEVAHVITSGVDRYVRAFAATAPNQLRLIIKFLDRSLADLMAVGLERRAKADAKRAGMATAKPTAAAASASTTTATTEAVDTKTDSKTGDGDSGDGGDGDGDEDEDGEGEDGGEGEDDDDDEADDPDDPSNWTMEEQQLLEAALRTFTAVTHPDKNERWDRIALAVPGKSRKACVERFKFIALMLQEIKTQRAAAAAEQKGGAAAKKAKKPVPKPVASASGGGAESDDDDDGVADTKTDQKTGAGLPIAKIELNPNKKGTQIKLTALRFTNVPLLKTVTLHLTVGCERCKTGVDMALTPGKVVNTKCAQCHHAIGVRLRAEMMHENNNCLGYLDLEYCTVKDYLPSAFSATCFDCFTEMPIKDFQRATVRSGTCVNCHKALSVTFEGITFFKLAAAGESLAPKQTALSDTQKRQRKSRKEKNAAQLKTGVPLPNNGACKHYRRSLRWLRFPCCGKAFPCELCHALESDHESKWAQRMLCGMCSREQAISAMCISCGFEFDRKSTHWEGGTGCRDTTKMSKKDAKKFVGSATKTKSAKANRVGPKNKRPNAKK